MTVNTKNLVSITEANQNFSRVARLVDENGAAVILKNNVPRYVLLEFSQAEQEQHSIAAQRQPQTYRKYGSVAELFAQHRIEDHLSLIHI